MWYARIPVRIVGLNGVKIPITIPMDPCLFSYRVVRRQQMIMLMYHKSTAYVCVCVCVCACVRACVCMRMFSCLTIIWTCVCTVPWLVTYHVHVQYYVQVDRFLISYLLVEILNVCTTYFWCKSNFTHLATQKNWGTTNSPLGAASCSI